MGDIRMSIATAPLATVNGSQSTVGALSGRAMLVDLTIRKWSARRRADEIVRDAVQTYGIAAGIGAAGSEWVTASKRLMICPEFRAIEQLATEAYQWHRARTLPWLDNGARILSAMGYWDYVSYMRDLETGRWPDAVAAFGAVYDARVTEALAALGGLGRALEFPTWADVSAQYSVGYRVAPLPDAGDFRIDLGDAEVSRVRAELTRGIEAATSAAMADVGERIAAVVGHMATSLRGYTGGRAGAFRDSLVSNVRELTAILPALNITGDPLLADVARRMADELCALDADTLRESEGARARVADSADSILGAMSQFMA